jgi:DNA-binding NtrC family response regulator
MAEVSRRPRILLLDDERVNLELLERILRGYEVESHVSPDAALDALRKQEFHLILSDYRMPQMDGVTFLERTRFLMPRAERVLVSGYTDFAILREAINRAHVQHFIAKPFAPDEVLSLARRIRSEGTDARTRVLVLGAGLLSASQRSALEEAGCIPEFCEVVPAPVPSALPPDLVVFDLRAPDDDTVQEAWLEVMRRWPTTSMLLVALPGQLEVVVGLAGFDATHDILLFPFSREEILLRVRRLIEKRKLGRELDRLRKEQPLTPALQALRALIDRTRHPVEIGQGEKAEGTLLAAALAEFEHLMIEAAFAGADNDAEEAARRLGTTPEIVRQHVGGAAGQPPTSPTTK